jgi:hypothetical protein
MEVEDEVEENIYDEMDELDEVARGLHDRSVKSNTQKQYIGKLENVDF